MAVMRPSSQRRRLLAAVSAAHDEWVDARISADDTPFHARQHGSDYNLHHIDVEATPRQLDDFARRVQAKR